MNAESVAGNPCEDPALQQGYYAPTGYEVGPPEPVRPAETAALQARIDALELLGEDRSEAEEIELAKLATAVARFEDYGEPIPSEHDETVQHNDGGDA